nr:PadR family transcriptional regulator [Neobacillus sp. Marseille-Q6967]
MEDRLKNLKKIMDQRTFPGLTFTEEIRKNVLEAIKKEEREEDILLAVMQLLVQAKTGYELTTNLRGRGIRKFENDEGAVYTILHRLEHSGYLYTEWNDQGAKYYTLNQKGKKLLRKAEQKQAKPQLVLKELLEG